MKYVLVSFLLAATFYACKQPIGNNNEALIHQYFSFFNKHDWQGMAAMYADTATFKDPSFGSRTVQQTRQQTVAKYTALSEAFPDVRDEVTWLYPSGSNHLVVELVSRGTAPDGKKFELPICTIFTFEQGKIVKDFTYYDNF